MGIGVTVINSVNDNYTVKQAVGVGVSVLIMLILSLIDYHFITKFTLPLYITVFPKSEDYILGYLEMNKKNIELLTYSEYECG